MRQFFPVLGTLAILLTSNALADVKPSHIDLEIQSEITLPAADKSLGHLVLDGKQGVYCEMYNNTLEDLVIPSGTTVLLTASHWNSEASWTQRSGPLSISCGGPTTGSKLGGDSLSRGAILAINSGMDGILRIQPVDILDGKHGPGEVTSECYSRMGMVTYTTSVNPNHSRAQILYTGRYGGSVVSDANSEGVNSPVRIEKNELLKRTHVVYPPSAPGKPCRVSLE